MNIARRSMTILTVAAAMLGLGWLSRAPFDPAAADEGLLRLSWRLRGERIENCRPRTPAELEKLPVHMRTPTVCDARLVAYRLIVAVDDGAPDTTRALPGGARGDRPLFVLREIPLEPGEHRIRVRFEPEDTTTGLTHALTLDTLVDATPGRIHLVTIAPDTDRMVMR